MYECDVDDLRCGLGLPIHPIDWSLICLFDALSFHQKSRLNSERRCQYERQGNLANNLLPMAFQKTTTYAKTKAKLRVTAAAAIVTATTAATATFAFVFTNEVQQLLP